MLSSKKDLRWHYVTGAVFPRRCNLHAERKLHECSACSNAFTVIGWVLVEVLRPTERHCLGKKFGLEAQVPLKSSLVTKRLLLPWLLSSGQAHAAKLTRQRFQLGKAEVRRRDCSELSGFEKQRKEERGRMIGRDGGEKSAQVKVCDNRFYS